MNYTNLASLIDEKRKDLGWSMNDLGRESGMSGSQIANVLGGRSKPGIDFVVKVSVALRIPTNDVLKRAGFPTVGDSAPGLTPHEAAMLRDYRRLSPEMRVRAAKIIEDLL